jgi:hypothetical protein
MRKLIKKFLHWVMREDEDGPKAERGVVISTRNHHRDELLKPIGVQFTVYAAEGGTVVETTMYDRKTDEHEHKLFIIPEGEPFGTHLDQIVTMERLRRWH